MKNIYLLLFTIILFSACTSNSPKTDTQKRGIASQGNCIGCPSIVEGTTGSGQENDLFCEDIEFCNIPISPDSCYTPLDNTLVGNLMGIYQEFCDIHTWQDSMEIVTTNLSDSLAYLYSQVDSCCNNNCDNYDVQVIALEHDLVLSYVWNNDCAVVGNGFEHTFHANIAGGTWEVNTSNMINGFVNPITAFGATVTANSITLNTDAIGTHYFVLRYTANGRVVWYRFTSNGYNQCSSDYNFGRGGINCIRVVKALVTGGTPTSYEWSSSLGQTPLWQGGNESVWYAGEEDIISVSVQIDDCDIVSDEGAILLVCQGDCPDTPEVVFNQYNDPNNPNATIVHADVLPLALFYECTPAVLGYVNGDIQTTTFPNACADMADVLYCGWYSEGMNMTSQDGAEIIVEVTSEQNQLCFATNLVYNCGYVCDCISFEFENPCENRPAVEIADCLQLSGTNCFNFSDIGTYSNNTTFAVQYSTDNAIWINANTANTVCLNDTISNIEIRTINTYDNICEADTTYYSLQNIENCNCYEFYNDSGVLLSSDLSNCPNCKLTSVNIQALQDSCQINGEFPLYISNIAGVDLSNAFTASVNGQAIAGSFLYADLPILIGNYVGDGTTIYEVGITDSEDPTCQTMSNATQAPMCPMCDTSNAVVNISPNITANTTDFEVSDAKCLGSGPFIHYISLVSSETGTYEVSTTLGSEFAVGGSGTPAISTAINANSPFTFTSLETNNESVIVVRFCNAFGKCVVRQLLLDYTVTCNAFGIDDVENTFIRRSLSSLSANGFVVGGVDLGIPTYTWQVLSGNLSITNGQGTSVVQLDGCAGILQLTVGTSCGDIVGTDTLDYCGNGDCLGNSDIAFEITQIGFNQYYVQASVNLQNELLVSYPSPEWWFAQTNITINDFGNTWADITVNGNTDNEICFGSLPNNAVVMECGDMEHCEALVWEACTANGLNILNLVVTDELSCGDCNGSFTFEVIGGTPPYTISSITDNNGSVYPILLGGLACGSPAIVSGTGTNSDPLTVTNIYGINSYTVSISDPNLCLGNFELTVGRDCDFKTALDVSNCDDSTGDICFEVAANNDNVPTFPNTTIACVSDTISYSTDGGNTWTQGTTACVDSICANITYQCINNGNGNWQVVFTGTPATDNPFWQFGNLAIPPTIFTPISSDPNFTAVDNTLTWNPFTNGIRNNIDFVLHYSVDAICDSIMSWQWFRGLDTLDCSFTDLGATGSDSACCKIPLQFRRRTSIIQPCPTSQEQIIQINIADYDDPCNTYTVDTLSNNASANRVSNRSLLPKKHSFVNNAYSVQAFEPKTTKKWDKWCIFMFVWIILLTIYTFYKKE